MNIQPNKIRRAGLAIGVSLAIAFPTGCIAKGGKMKNRIKEMPMKTVCVGRFLIDIPREFAISVGGVHVGRWNISTVGNESEEEFSQRLLAKEQELTEQRNERNRHSLEALSNIQGVHIQGRAFMHQREWNYYVDGGKRVDTEAVTFLALIHSAGKTFELGTTLMSEEEFAEKTRLASQIENWSFDRIPTQPGFCFGEGFVHEPLTINEHEFVMMFAGMEQYPDLSMAISTAAGIKLNATLLARHENSSTRKKYASRFKSLGTGKREINGIRGEQVADQVSELNGTTGYRFEWESAMEKENVLRPRILLELETGTGSPNTPVNSSLSKDEVLELWKKISSSIRDRPENVLKTATAAGQ